WWMLGHLKPEVTVKEGEADFTVIAKRLAAVYPTEYPKHFTVQMDSLTNMVVGRFRTTLYIVLAAVGLLLLIGCGNVANLLLVRGVTLGVAVLTALVFGLVPALKAARKDINEPLRDSGKGISGGFRHGKLRDAVVVLEVGLSLKLLVAAGLLMRSFVALREVKLGLQPDHIFVAGIPLPPERYKTADQMAGFYGP